MRILPALLLLPALSLAGEPGEHLLDWLVGCWMAPDGSAQEVWVADSDGGLSGFSVSVADNKVSFYETLTIRSGQDGTLGKGVDVVHGYGNQGEQRTVREFRSRLPAADQVHARYRQPASDDLAAGWLEARLVRQSCL